MFNSNVIVKESNYDFKKFIIMQKLESRTVSLKPWKIRPVDKVNWC